MSLIKTKVKTFEDNRLDELEQEINEFTNGVDGKVLNIDIKPFDSLGYGLCYLGIVTYHDLSLFKVGDDE
ncbi:YrzA family protein [Macrococcoides canis]|nr:YrzA family protein [Macrococcus canis]